MKYRTFRCIPAGLAMAALLVAGWWTGLDGSWAVTGSLSVQSTPEDGIEISVTIGVAAPTVLTTNTIISVSRGAAVSMTAPATFNHRPFAAWYLTGVPGEYSTERTINFGFDDNMTFTAAYGAQVFKLNVTSSPDTGIEFLNEDITTLATPYEREFSVDPQPYEAIVNAPVTHNGKPFSRWLLNGAEASTLHVINLVMDQDYTLEAQYGSGSITCKIQPKAARKQARWRIDGGAWLKRGVTVSGLRIGDHTLEWAPVTGFKTPKTRVVPIADGDALTIRGRYFPLK